MTRATHTRGYLLLACAVLAALTCGLSSTNALAQPRPTIRLIATGGTISNRPGGRLTASQLVGAIPELIRYVHTETEQFSNVSSNVLTLEDWLRLSRHINRLFETRTDLSGIVVTVGTDTLEEIAFFLHLTVRSERPVVVVGSMRRPQSPGYDGSANLLQAFSVAAARESRDRGVLVVLNNDVNSARDVTKTDALRLQTFSSRYGVLGFVDDDERVTYVRRVEKRHTHESEFDVRGVDALPRVDVLLSYQDAPGDLVRASVHAGARGLVVAATGAGSMSDSQREAVRTIIQEGVPVVLTTRTGGGQVSPRPRATALDSGQEQLGNSGWIAGHDLSPVKARVLLMLALTRTRDPIEIQRMFAEY